MSIATRYRAFHAEQNARFLSRYSMHPDVADVEEIPHEVMIEAREAIIADDAREGFPFEEPSVRAIERRAVELMKTIKE